MTRLYRAEFAKLLVRRLGWKEGGGEKDGVGGMGCGDGEDGVREVEMGRGRAEMRGDEKDGVAGGGLYNV